MNSVPISRRLIAGIAVLSAIAGDRLPAQETNLAIGKAVSASGATFAGLPPERLTDGDLATVSHPLGSAGTLGFTYEIDLGKEFSLDRIVLVNRAGCCPERLTNYSVRVFRDGGGAAGVQNWSADIRTDGSHAGDGGRDIMRAALDPDGTFAGRFIHVVNLSNAAYSPQIAEIEVYESPVPVISYFQTDAGNITATGNLALPDAATLAWSVTDAESVSISTIGEVAPVGFELVAPEVSTTFLLTATNGAGESTASVTVGVDEATIAPVLSEFMADNVATIDDQDGDSSDWIEIYNPNAVDFTLEGHFLTDDPDELTKWRFPPGAGAPANGYLVVFASGKNLTAPTGPLHTNFSLSKSGEYLALVAPDGTTVIGQFPSAYPATLQYPSQKQDFSYGLDADQNAGFFIRPTPGAANGTSFAGFVEDTKFDFNRGFYDEPIRLTISSATPGATIRYTRDGSLPTETHGSTYTQPLGIASTLTVRAIAYKPGLAPTNVDTHTYIYVDRVLRSPIMRQQEVTEELRASLKSLPAMSIVTPSTLNGSSEVRASLEMIFPDGTEGFQEDCGVKEFGGAFTPLEKTSLRLYFRGAYGAAKLKYPVFEGFDRGIAPPARFDQLNLRSGSHDMSLWGFYMSNRFTDDTMLEMGNINPHGRFVHVYLNGTYWGQYHLRERWNASTLSEYLGGPKEAYEAINGNWNVGGWADSVIDAYDGDGTAWTRIKRLARNYEEIQPYLDVAHYIDYMIMWMFGHAEDEYRCVGPADVGSGFKWFLNDSDGYLRTSAGNRTGFASSLPGVFGRSPGDGPGSIFSMLFKEGHPDYRMLLADRIHKHYFNDGAMTPERTIARLEERISEIDESMKAEAIRWRYRTHSSWRSAADPIRNSWLPRRTGDVVNHFKQAGFYSAVAAPTFNQRGGAVPSGFRMVLSGPGRFYYTLDGSDPRLPGGDLNPSAQRYERPEGGIVLTKNTFIRVRTLIGRDWSALEEVFFTVGGAPPVAPGQLVISELHYNPAGAGDTEFIELQNISDQAINLRGVTFTDGVEYSFAENRDTVLAAGQVLLLVDSQFAIDRTYGLGLPIGGVYRGNLANDGERVALSAPNGELLVDFTYDDRSPWPEGADGAGFSMTMANLEGDPADPANWRVGLEAGGSPGAIEGAAFVGDPDADQDQDGFTAFAEHALGTSDSNPADARSAIQLKVDQDGRLIVEFPRNLAAIDVETIVEISSDLVNWANGDGAVEFLSQEGTLATYRTISGAPDQPELFIRLRFNSR